MCGPIACAPGVKEHPTPYHLGRGISYTLLGALAGSGSQALQNIKSLAQVNFYLMTGLLFFMGLSFLFNWKMPTPPAPRFFLKALRAVKSNSLHLGLLTGLLPCGWLYSFVLLALSSRSPLEGSMILFCFWVGTIPALSSLQFSLSKLSLHTRKKMRIFMGLVIICAALYSVVQHTLSHL